MTSPVVFGIKKSVAQRLGFVGREVRVKDILEAIKAKRLSFAMTSASQSNSGASAYLGFLYALLGNPDLLTKADLARPELKTGIRSLLSGINRSSGSSAWLKDLFLASDYDAMVNYESLIIETNHELVKSGKEALYVVYPVDGIVMSDFPLGRRTGIAAKQGDALCISDFGKLLSLDLAGRKWSDIGVAELYGKIAIASTDPNKSNSGMMFAGLMANVLQGEVVDAKTVDARLPAIQAFYSRLGYMESTTGVLFDQYLRTGVGSYPLIVGYENQIVEFARQNPEIQKIAWEQHGFRTALAGAQNDPKILQVQGIPESVTKVIPMPTPEVMDMILAAIQGGTK
jgi:hypothetical protein